MKRAAITVIAVVIFGFLISYVGTAYAVYKEGAVSNGGSIKGKVTFKGALPDDAVEKVTITKNTDVCGTGAREVVWVDVKGNALRGAFVFIDGITEGKAWPAPGKASWPAAEGDKYPEEGKYIIVQKGCRFRPWAQVIKPGNITIRNSDNGVLHNINTREMIGVESGSTVKKVIFNFGQPDPGDIEKELKPRRSHFIGINCEAHNFMFGFMMAPEHPYAEVVGEDGSFTIKDVPPGTYTVKAWHPRFGLKEAKVTVAAKGAADANFEFSK
ncbi:MAG: DUF2012 domain-containing protein [Deltaproteobacteria bacterium]|nr:DUF2012 domain-containing protein [Deltaproteobacteria bacterium]